MSLCPGMCLQLWTILTDLTFLTFPSLSPFLSLFLSLSPLSLRSINDREIQKALSSKILSVYFPEALRRDGPTFPLLEVLNVNF